MIRMDYDHEIIISIGGTRKAHIYYKPLPFLGVVASKEHPYWRTFRHIPTVIEARVLWFFERNGFLLHYIKISNKKLIIHNFFTEVVSSTRKIKFDHVETEIFSENVLLLIYF